MGKPIAICQSCGQDSCIEVLDLGNQPICNKFLNSESEFSKERFYPLKLNFCKNCKLVQLDNVPPADEVFDKDFNYLTSSTSDGVLYFNLLAKESTKKFGLKAGDFVLDIGSNDGTLLKHFKNNGVANVLGIDPAPIQCKMANDAGIETINNKFEDGIDAILQRTSHSIKLIMALNVIAHTDTVHPFLDGVKKIMSANKATFISMSHYLPNMIYGREYDMIYHEHARYYSITALMYLFEKHGLFIYDAEKINLYGGAILVYANGSPTEKTARLNSLLKEEEPFKEAKIYESFSKAVKKNGVELHELLQELKKRGKRIVGVGAPMKSSTLLNYCKIDGKILDYITELNSLKIGTYTPGTHIKVTEEDRIFKDNPDVCLILSWNVADRIIKTFRSKGYKGSFIVPIPNVRVVQ